MSEVDLEELPLAALYEPHSKYSPEQKLEAVMAYVVTGGSKAAGKICGIPPATIRDWKTRSKWWPDALHYCRREKNDVIDARITKILDIGLSEIEDMIINGEEVSTRDGIIRKKVSARDMAIVLGTMYDKRCQMRGEPTSHVSKKDTAQVLEQLKVEFEKFSKNIKNAKVVSEQ